MKFRLDGITYTSTWKLGNKRTPVTVHDPDTGQADSTKPYLPAIEPFLRKWEKVKEEAIKQMQTMDIKCTSMVPKYVLISVLSKDNTASFEIGLPLVDYLPDQDLIANITGDLEGNNILIDVNNSDY